MELCELSTNFGICNSRARAQTHFLVPSVIVLYQVSSFKFLLFVLLLFIIIIIIVIIAL